MAAMVLTLTADVSLARRAIKPANAGSSTMGLVCGWLRRVVMPPAAAAAPALAKDSL